MNTDTWHVAVVACAIAAALGGVVSVLLPGRHSPPAPANCGVVTCIAAIPPPATEGAAIPPARTVDHDRHPHHRARYHATPSVPLPAPAPSPPPRHHAHRPGSAGPRITVSYSVSRSWDGGFLGHFTITNHGSRPLSRWIVNATLPGDHIESSWGASYQAEGDTLIMTPAPYDPAVAPSGSQSAYFTAAGSTTRPTSYGVSGGGN